LRAGEAWGRSSAADFPCDCFAAELAGRFLSLAHFQLSGGSALKLRDFQRTYVRRVRLIQQHRQFTKHGTRLRHLGDVDAFLDDCDRALPRDLRSRRLAVSSPSPRPRKIRLRRQATTYPSGALGVSLAKIVALPLAATDGHRVQRAKWSRCAPARRNEEW
jgi:hypothetical protein